MRWLLTFAALFLVAGCSHSITHVTPWFRVVESTPLTFDSGGVKKYDGQRRAWWGWKSVGEAQNAVALEGNRHVAFGGAPSVVILPEDRSTPILLPCTGFAFVAPDRRRIVCLGRTSDEPKLAADQVGVAFFAPSGAPLVAYRVRRPRLPEGYRFEESQESESFSTIIVGFFRSNDALLLSDCHPPFPFDTARTMLSRLFSIQPGGAVTMLAEDGVCHHSPDGRFWEARLPAGSHIDPTWRL